MSLREYLNPIVDRIEDMKETMRTVGCVDEATTMHYIEMFAELELTLDELILRKENLANKNGILRNIDNVGRLCLPKEMRDLLGMDDHDPVFIRIIDDSICITKPDVTQSTKQAITTFKQTLEMYCNAEQLESISEALTTIEKTLRNK